MAQKKRADLHAAIDLRLPDNTNQEITPADVRGVLHQVVDSALLPASDDTGQTSRSLAWSVIYLTKAEALASGNPTYATLDQIPANFLCTGSTARVDLHPDKYGQELLLVYDDRADVRAGIRGFLDSNFVLNPLTYDGLQPLKWVKRGSVEEAQASIRRYDSTYAKWGLDETMKIELGGTDAFFSAVAAGGPFPAPTQAGVGTAAWKPAASPRATDLTAIVDQHSLQLATLGVKGSPVYGYLDSSEEPVGYTSLDEALADPRQKTFLRFNKPSLFITKPNTGAGSFYINGEGATVTVSPNVTYTLPGNDIGALSLERFYLQGGRGSKINLLTNAPATTPPALLPRLDGSFSCPVWLVNGGAVALRGSYGSLNGTGTVYVLEPFQCDNVAPGITLVRSGGGRG